MKILIFMSGGFDTYGPSRHLYDALIEDLLEAGHIIHLIESHTTGKDPDVPEKFANNKNFSFETISSIQVEKRAFAKRYLVGVKYCFDCIPVLKKQKNFDVMMVQSCPWAPFAISFAKKYVKIPTIWNIQDMFPGASIANGAMKQKWMQKFFYLFHKIAYKKADHIIVISEDMKNKVIIQGVPENKITVIPDWYDDKSVKEIPWDENLFVKKYNMKKDIFYVQYAGTMGFNFDYRLVLKVAEILKNEKDIIFQMIGFGSQKDIFMKEAKVQSLDNIVFLPIESQEMVPHVYSACSICLIPLPKGVIGNSVPSKAGLLMACHRVIVTSADSDSNYIDMFNREEIGIGCDCDSPQKIAESIIKLKNERKVLEKLADNAQAYGKKVYTRSINTKKYESVYKKFVEEK